MDEAAWDAMAVVGRVARAHGIRGHVIVNPETDFPESRFRAGAVLWMRREGRVGPVTIAALAAERDIEILVFDVSAASAMKRAVLGERVGTLVHVG